MATPTKLEIERALKAAGLSCRAAKKLLSGGWRLVVGDEAAMQAELEEKLDQLSERLKILENK